MRNRIAVIGLIVLGCAANLAAQPNAERPNQALSQLRAGVWLERGGFDSFEPASGEPAGPIAAGGAKGGFRAVNAGWDMPQPLPQLMPQLQTPTLTTTLPTTIVQAPVPVEVKQAQVAQIAAARAIAAVPNDRLTPCEDLRNKARRLRTAAGQCDTDVSNGAPYCNVVREFESPSIPRSLSAEGARGYARRFEDVANGESEYVCANFGGQGAIPAEDVPTELQQPGSGVGPLYRRTWSTTIRNGKNAQDLMHEIKTNINKFSRGRLIADTPFEFKGGPNPSEISVGNTYGIDGPMRFNPYVKTTEVDSISFEFTTLKGHPEAARVRFMAYDSGSGTVFIISVHGHPSTKANKAMYLAGYWVQTQIWDNFTENVRRYCGGESTVVARTSLEE